MVSSTPVSTSHVDPTDPSKHLDGQKSFHILVGTVQHIMSTATTGITITSISFIPRRCLTGHSPTSTQSPLKENLQQEINQWSGKAGSTIKIRSSSEVNQINEDFHQYRKSAQVDKRLITKDNQSKYSIQDISRSVPKSQVNRTSTVFKEIEFIILIQTSHSNLRAIVSFPIQFNCNHYFFAFDHKLLHHLNHDPNHSHNISKSTPYHFYLHKIFSNSIVNF